MASLSFHALDSPGLRSVRKVVLDASDIGQSITGDPASLRFSIDGVPFKPFFETYGRHSVYLHVRFGEPARVPGF